MEKLLLDTDIGGDIDDALCLAYLLKEPECDLVGIIERITGTGGAQTLPGAYRLFAVFALPSRMLLLTGWGK